MNYGRLNLTDVANGEGVRVSLFVSGCTRHCPGCFNPETWDFAYGRPYTPAVEAQILAALAPDYISGLSILGGEPFEPANQPAVLGLVRRVREIYPQKTIWCYTGCTLERELLAPTRWRTSITDDLLAQIDVLVDGPFIEAERDLRLAFRGSANQRLLPLREQRVD